MIPCKHCISLAMCQSKRYYKCELLVNSYIKLFKQTNIQQYMQDLFTEVEVHKQLGELGESIDYQYHEGLYMHHICDPKIKKLLITDIYETLGLINNEKERLYRIYKTSNDVFAKILYINITINHQESQISLCTNLIKPELNSSIRLYFND